MSSFFELKRQVCPSTPAPQMSWWLTIVDPEKKHEFGEFCLTSDLHLHCQANLGPTEGVAIAPCQGARGLGCVQL